MEWNEWFNILRITSEKWPIHNVFIEQIPRRIDKISLRIHNRELEIFTWKTEAFSQRDIEAKK